MIEFFIGVDGGGSGTRVRLARADGVEFAEGAAGPSGLMHGIAKAWAAVNDAAAQAFTTAGLSFPDKSRIAIGLGLAGVHNRQWAAEFVDANPGYARVALESDGHTTVLGAHAGQPGAIIALGTGSVGEIKLADGRHVEVGGWGFPAGDEASGAWMGLRAINHVQQVLDGRMAANAFATDVANACGGERNAIQTWLAQATQTNYAQLARIVLQHGDSNDTARAILLAAGREVELMGNALDASGKLPIALCGGLAAPLRPYLPVSMLKRIVNPQGDSAAGALRLIQQRLKD
ncbi:ATPase [Pseudoduganella sp. FT26W]|uniref:ATPase n=2 Tax=Duganella TaxID=75654 RepID=A0A6L5QI83_9BURK|nr:MULTISPECIES: BadF/BadG/BcrA/BcrD ATPase family protein [Duganella]MRW85516.1 ATPase [Duganella aquatilis]MRX09355.1 ATPase [Duganella alba]MRX19912.1 ATPase [Duganella alba]